jgi:hypothetical protein
MEDQGRPGDDDLVDRSDAFPLVERERLRNALGFPEPKETTPSPTRLRRRQAQVTEVIDPASDATATAPAANALESLEASPAWRADLNQLYAALSERLRVHSEDVTRQLYDERMRLAGLLTTVVEQVSKLSGAPAPSDIGGVEARVLAGVEEITRELTNERQGLVSVVCSIEEQLVELRSELTARPRSPASIHDTELTDFTTPRSNASAVVLAGIEAQLADIRAAIRPPAEPVGLERVEARLGQIVAALAAMQPSAAPAPASDAVRDEADALRRDMVGQLEDLRAQLAQERAGRDAWLDSVATRLAGRLVTLAHTDPAAENGSTDLEAVLAAVRALGRTVSSAAAGIDRGPEVAVLHQTIAALTERQSTEISMDAVADDLDTMRKEIDERLGGIESALADIRTALRSS